MDEIVLEPDDGYPRQSKVVEVGRPRRPGQTKRVVVGAAIALLIVVVLGATGGGGTEQVAEPETTTTSTRRPSTTTTRAPRTTTSTTTLPPGPMLDQPTGITLVLLRERSLDTADLDTGQVETVFQSTYFSWLVPTSEPSGIVYVDDQPQALFMPFPLAVTQAKRRLGPAVILVRSAQPHQVWLATDQTDRLLVTQVDTGDGHIVTSPVPLPIGSNLFGSVYGGLVAEAAGRIFLIEDGGDVRPIAEGRGLAAGGNQVAAYSCDDVLQCGLEVIDVATGDSRRIAPPPGTAPYEYTQASFSPDGSLLAIWMQADFEFGLYLWDLRTEEVTAVPGTQEFGGGGPPEWSPKGTWLFWTGGAVYAYHPGDPTSIRLPLPKGDYYQVLAVQSEG